MSRAPLLIEIGCEEIPARMIQAAAAELARRLVRLLDQAGLEHGAEHSRGGPRRLAARVEQVQERQSDREELVLGPPAGAAFTTSGEPTAAALGFARKQGVDAAHLSIAETERGRYVSIKRQVTGKTVGEVLAQGLPPEVEAIPFPKTMRWAEGRWRWVRPVHWLLALHGGTVLPIELFGVKAEAASRGHRFLSPGAVSVPHADRYTDALRDAYVIVDPEERRSQLGASLAARAKGAGEQLRIETQLVADEELLDEVVNLVEWPDVVSGSFPDVYRVELPDEIVATTLRHHQKAFSVAYSDGKLSNWFLTVSNQRGDPKGHIRRGNEWVVGGRLEDALFFWREDRKRSLESKRADLDRITYHALAGTYHDKVGRMESLVASLADSLEVGDLDRHAALTAARFAKVDLVTALVGEFPELQGIVGGLLLQAEGAEKKVWQAVYDHYRPRSPSESIPRSDVGCLVSIADKLDTVGQLVAAGERPSGSKDPFALRRACNGIFRMVLERSLPFSLNAIWLLSGGQAAVWSFIEERFTAFLLDQGYSIKKIRSVLEVGDQRRSTTWSLAVIKGWLDAVARPKNSAALDALGELTKRIRNIVPQVSKLELQWIEEDWLPPPHFDQFVDPKGEVQSLKQAYSVTNTRVQELASAGRYDEVVDELASLSNPVKDFFDKVLAVDPENRELTWHRGELLGRLRDLLTRYFDITHLAGEAERRAA